MKTVGAHITILGVDPGFASVGIARVGVYPEGAPVLQRLAVLHTEKSSKKRGVLVSDDNFRRARELTVALVKEMDGVQVVCAESMSYPRASSAAAKMAMCWGVLSALCETRGLPMVQASPQEVKKYLCGDAGASKEKVQETLRTWFPMVLDGAVEGIPKSAREHPYDALAAVVTCLRSEVIVALRKMAGSKTEE